MSRPDAPTPERWQVRAGAADVATLAIPPDARRERVFEIDCRFVVRAPEPLAGAWHEMRVTVNGAQEWARRADTANPGHTDSLDLHFRRAVPVGQALKVVAQVRCRGAQPLELRIEAEENP